MSAGSLISQPDRQLLLSAKTLQQCATICGQPRMQSQATPTVDIARLPRHRVAGHTGQELIEERVDVSQGLQGSEGEAEPFRRRLDRPRIRTSASGTPGAADQGAKEPKTGVSAIFTMTWSPISMSTDGAGLSTSPLASPARASGHRSLATSATWPAYRAISACGSPEGFARSRLSMPIDTVTVRLCGWFVL